MATRELQVILNSGELSQAYFGGTAATDKVQIKSDMTGANVSFDNSLTSLVATTVQAAIVELANVGLAHMALATPYTVGQSVGLTASKISLFDTISQDINGAVTPLVDTSESVHTHKFTIDKTGLYAVYGNATAEFSSSAIVALILYKNGAPASEPIALQGRGAGKPVLFSYNDLLSLTATDYLEIYAYSDTAATSTLITVSSVIVERKPLA